ncbi:MAG: haloacid dehalogenase-like hydrolase [Actinobacteria bacterium]|nr:haloacid dehalogenase-like hydrolase [Actinomycetota bacterium]
MSRLLDLFGPDLAALRGDDLIRAIEWSEGRTTLAEIVAPRPPVAPPASNLELVAAFGADLVCLNMVSPAAARVTGLDGEGFYGLSEMIGRPVGLNLEPDMPSVPPEYRATEVNARATQDAGASFVFITANPGRGTKMSHLAAATETFRSAAPGVVCFAGKMHAAGEEETIDSATVRPLLDAGAQGLLVPVPGTVPGVTESGAEQMVRAAHDHDALAVGTIGTSQEGADPATVRTLALAAKRIGVDVHHIGDSWISGVASPENIYAYSVAIRGVRHTWTRMAVGAQASREKEGRDGLS